MSQHVVSLDMQTKQGSGDLSDYSLPAWIYSDAEFLELENEHIFKNTWQTVCHISDIPNAGDYHTFRLLNETVFVVRDKDGSIKAFHNVCRHRAARLLDGDKGHCVGRITCPYHAWSYGLDGRLIGLPEKEHYEGIDLSGTDLTPLDCEVFMGIVCIRLNKGGPSVAEMMAPIVDELTPYRLEKLKPYGPIDGYIRNVNWKNGVDNYIDALHVRAAHPGLNSLIGKTYNLEDRETFFRLYGQVDHMKNAGQDIKDYCDILPEVDYLPESHQRLWLYYMLFPNTAFNIYPDSVELMQFLPLSATQTHIRFSTYIMEDARPEMEQARALNYKINNQVGIEDTDLIERVQEGMASSSFVRGPFGRHEACLRGFARRIRETLPVSTLETKPLPGTIAAKNQELMALAR